MTKRTLSREVIEEIRGYHFEASEISEPQLNTLCDMALANLDLEKQLRDGEPQRYPILVACAIIIQDGSVLLEKRRPSGEASKDNLWDIPGGKVENGEQPEDAVVREIKEELGVVIKVISQLSRLFSSTWNHPEGDRYFILIGFLCTIISGQPKLTEELQWFDVNTLSPDEVMSPDFDMIRSAVQETIKETK
jgi:mutator protein MutT